MVCWYTLLWRNVAEHSFLLVIVAAHSLVSLAFLLSDEIFELKLQRKWVFQQAAKGVQEARRGWPDSESSPQVRQPRETSIARRFRSLLSGVEQPEEYRNASSTENQHEGIRRFCRQ